MRFNRLFFGGKFAPYLAVQGHARATELMLGNPKDTSNPFQWDKTHLNYPFSKNYDPSLPRIMKLRKDGNLAAGCPTYMDDGRPTGSTKGIAESAARRLSSYTNYLGEQDAARKRHPCLLPQEVGPGSCSIAHLMIRLWLYFTRNGESFGRKC